MSGDIRSPLWVIIRRAFSEHSNLKDILENAALDEKSFFQRLISPVHGGTWEQARVQEGVHGVRTPSPRFKFLVKNSDSPVKRRQLMINFMIGPPTPKTKFWPRAWGGELFCLLRYFSARAL